MIGIRTDANSIIATGHMMRCMTIAKAIVSLGGSVVFFVADEESLRLFNKISGEGIEAVVLETDYSDMEGELESLKRELIERQITSLLVDSYSVTTGYFAGLKDICKVTYIDDLAAIAYPVNTVINYSGYAKNMGYSQLYRESSEVNSDSVKLLLGLDYAPLRSQFYEYNKEPEAHDKINVLISTGGADTCGMLMPLMKTLSSMALDMDVELHVVVGDFVKNPDEIISFAEERENCIIHRSVKDMAALMRDCDIAVTAAGTMLTECVATTLPTVFYQVADNQKYNVTYFGNLDGMLFAGDAQKDEGVVTKIAELVRNILSSPGKLESMKKSLSNITDGRGALRIAKALMEEEI